MYSSDTESEKSHDCGHIDCFFSNVLLWTQVHDMPLLQMLGILDIVKLRIIDSIEECSGEGEE